MECISHHEAIARLIKEHDEIKPFAPENGQKLKFKVGDKVAYINDYGCIFEGKTITKSWSGQTTRASTAQGAGTT